MDNGNNLTPRVQGILQAVVKSYIENGLPVASRTIARAYPEALSPASIRNVMQDLSEEGYLAQPHTSAGRIPTAKAFQAYVGSLKARQTSPEEVDRVRQALARFDTLAGRFEYCSQQLMELTSNIGVTAAIHTDAQHLDSVELISLPESRVLMCVVTRDGTVRNRVVRLQEAFTEAELSSIRNYLNANFRGWSLARARAELERLLSEQRAAYDSMFRRLVMLYEKGLLEEETTSEVHLQGISNLLGCDWKLTRERLHQMFRALDEKKRILELLDRFLEPSGEVAVRVGLGEAHPTLEELSLIGTTITLSNGVTAKIAVIGPMRMRYSRAISAVMRMGQAFEALNS
jgi:heat-inducible transcriptional repressor